MDRRMLLAMVLAIVVLLINTLLFAPRRKPAPAPEASQSTQTTATQTTTTPPSMEAARPEPGPPPGQGTIQLRNTAIVPDTTGTIHVDTKLVEVELDPVGGVIRSWKLLHYTDPAGSPADLVRERGNGDLWFALQDNGRLIRTDSTRFHTEIERGTTETTIRFTARDSSGIDVEKTYRIPQDRYDCSLEISVGGVHEGGFWETGWLDGLPILERDPRNDYMAVSSVALFGKEFIHTRPGGGHFGCAKSNPESKSESHEGSLRWFGVRNRYFLGALLLKEPADLRVETTSDGLGHAAGAKMFQPFSLGGKTDAAYTIYLGPIVYSSLEKYRVGLERVQDLGPGVIRPFSRLLMKFFELVNHVVPNYGFEILILSILIRLIFYPLTKKSMDSMKRMQLLKPEIDRINERCKDDAERRNRETLELYRKNKINPLGGCIPILVQLPVLSGLYYVLANAVQLRKAPFILWIRDLSAPDTVAHVAGFPINVLPFVMAGTMLWQQKMTPTDPRQATLGYMMPIIMTFVFYKMSSGLVFYWTVSNLMTVLQQVWMNRQGGSARLAPVPVTTGEIAAKAGRKKRTR